MSVPKPTYRRFKSRAKRDPEQQRACIDRDGKCMICGLMDESLVGHHVESFGASGNDSLENMITLCFQEHENAGRGFIDYYRATPSVRSKYLPIPDERGRVWDCNSIFKRILEEEYYAAL